jgi:zinc protease
MKFGKILVLAAIAAVPALASAQTVAPPLKYETFTLPNGLKFIVHEDHSTPIVAVDVWYDVGAADEALGRSGFAHLFEHLMFQETQNLEKGDFDKYIEATGAQNNGTTSNDRTMYYEIIPSNRVNLALWIEADRMARLRVNEANFTREREVVKEERRMRIDNAPYMSGILTLDTLHTDYKPYRHTVIGTMDDLNAASVQDVLDFYKQYYVPNNATITLAGDITLAQAKKFADEYFASIPRGKEVPKLPPAPATPRTDGERRVRLEDKLASVPLIVVGYTIPPHDNDDVYALALLANILGRGESSRLNQALVKEAKVANFVGAFPDSRAKGGMLMIQTQPTQGNDVAKLEELMYAQIDKLKTEGISQVELDKAKRQFVAGLVMGRQTVLSKAEALQHARFMHGNIESVNSDVQKYNAITAADIRRVAEKYLTTANRSVITVVPAAKAATSD